MGTREKPVKKRRDSRPLYARVLRLKHIRPGSVLCFVFFELTIFVAAVLGFAELISWWMVPVLPLVVAVMVKLNDIIAGAAAGPSPVTAPDVADDDELVDYWSPRTEEEQGGYAEPRTVPDTDDVAASVNVTDDAEPAAATAGTEPAAGADEGPEGIEPERVVEVDAPSAVADNAGTRDDTPEAEKVRDGAPHAREAPAGVADDTADAADEAPVSADEAAHAADLTAGADGGEKAAEVAADVRDSGGATPGGREVTPDAGEDTPAGGEARPADSDVAEDAAGADHSELPVDPAEAEIVGEEAPTEEAPTIGVVTPPAPRLGTPPNGTPVSGRGSGEGDGAAEPVPELRRR